MMIEPCEKLEHEFSGGVYGSETGNYYGDCKHCGQKFATYTGHMEKIPPGVGRFGFVAGTAAGNDWDGVEKILFYRCLSLSFPNMVVRYKPCIKRDVEVKKNIFPGNRRIKIVGK